MKGTIFLKPFLLFLFILTGLISSSKNIRIEVHKNILDDAYVIAIERLREYSEAITHVELSPFKESRKGFELNIILGKCNDNPEIRKLWNDYDSLKNDSYLIKTISKNPLTLIVSGINNRGLIYAAYKLADILKSKEDVSSLNLYFQPKIKDRFVSFGATTHGRRYYRPALHYQSLKELPRYGYNGIIIYPGGGTPIARHSSPILEFENGQLFADKKNTLLWKNWFREIKSYDHKIMMAIPPLIPPGYDKDSINNFYLGGTEPDSYLENLQTHFRQFLKLLISEYPEIDKFMFNSTEGATFGHNKRFFESPKPERFSNEDYLRNNEQIMTSYFDVLKDFFKTDFNKVSFWTHSFGLTSEGIRKMREILFQFPEVMIIEDDFWNNNLWPFDLPAMAYLPKDLRREISKKNPFALFQIATDGEYYGGGFLPNAYPGSHIRSANEAIERNAEMVIQRIDLHDRTNYGTLFGTMEIVPFAASRQLWEPTPNEAEIWEDWVNRRFGKQAGPFIINALQESKNIILNGLSCNGIDLLAVGSEINPRLWFKETELSRFYLFSKPNVKMVHKNLYDIITSEEYTAYQMETHTIPIENYRKNQLSALQSIEKGLNEIEKARNYLNKKDYHLLKAIFMNGRDVINALQLLGEVAYAGNIILSNYDNVKDPNELFNKSIENLEYFINEESLIPEMNNNLEKILENYKQINN